MRTLEILDAAGTLGKGNPLRVPHPPRDACWFCGAVRGVQVVW